MRRIPAFAKNSHETLSNRALSYGVIVTHWIHSHETLSNRASSYRGRPFIWQSDLTRRLSRSSVLLVVEF